MHNFQLKNKKHYPPAYLKYVLQHPKKETQKPWKHGKPKYLYHIHKIMKLKDTCSLEEKLQQT